MYVCMTHASVCVCIDTKHVRLLTHGAFFTCMQQHAHVYEVCVWPARVKTCAHAVSAHFAATTEHGMQAERDIWSTLGLRDSLHGL